MKKITTLLTLILILISILFVSIRQKNYVSNQRISNLQTEILNIETENQKHVEKIDENKLKEYQRWEAMEKQIQNHLS